MDCKVYQLNSLVQYQYVVVLSRYHGNILLSRHKDRTTWETQGGHIEPGETPWQAAKRELQEESGAEVFSITPVFDYQVSGSSTTANGMVFVADISGLASMPPNEMAEVQEFDCLPGNLTYPLITPILFWEAEQRKLWTAKK